MISRPAVLKVCFAKSESLIKQSLLTGLVYSVRYVVLACIWNLSENEGL